MRGQDGEHGQTSARRWHLFVYASFRYRGLVRRSCKHPKRAMEVLLGVEVVVETNREPRVEKGVVQKVGGCLLEWTYA